MMKILTWYFLITIKFLISPPIFLSLKIYVNTQECRCLAYELFKTVGIYTHKNSRIFEVEMISEVPRSKTHTDTWGKKVKMNFLNLKINSKITNFHVQESSYNIHTVTTTTTFKHFFCRAFDFSIHSNLWNLCFDFFIFQFFHENCFAFGSHFKYLNIFGLPKSWDGQKIDCTTNS